jgi:ATP-dependent helicase HrpB
VAVSGATVVAILATNRDLQNRDDRALATDIEDLVTLVDQPDRTVLRAALTEVRDLREQLLRQLDISELDMGSHDDLRKSILTGFPERIGRVRADNGDVLLANGQQARIAAPGTQLICALGVQTRRDGTHTRAHVSVYSTTDVESVMELFLEQLTESSELAWDDTRERVIVTNRIALGRLVIEEAPSKTALNEDEAAALLFAKLKARGFANFVGEGFHETSLEQLQWRVVLANKVAGKECEATGLTDFDLENVLRNACRDRRSFAEIRALGLMNAVAEHLGPSAIAWLDRAVPATMQLKNGRKARITYSEHAAPSIASRLQDFFGQRETPSVLFGRVPLVVHLQAPNGRDVQVTADLPGFWANHYEKVRSELCRRYPRHAWPKLEELP